MCMKKFNAEKIIFEKSTGFRSAHCWGYTVNLAFSQFLVRGWYLGEKCKKNGLFRVQIGGRAFIRAWTFIRDFTVYPGNFLFSLGIYFKNVIFCDI